jgi:hypothetical protein
MKKLSHDDIILKAIASQIMLLSQAIYKGTLLVDELNQHELADHVWEEIAIHAKLTTLRKQELKEYQATYDFLKEKKTEK